MVKKKIGFIIHNKGIENINLKTIDLFNPGIGGTEYQLFLYLKKLFESFSSAFDFVGLLDLVNTKTLFDGPTFLLNNQENATSCDLLFAKAQDYTSIKDFNTKKILVFHNQPSTEDVKTIIKDFSVLPVFLSKSEILPYWKIPHIFKNSIICPNLVIPKDVLPKKPHKDPIIAFIGAIKPAKSFDVVLSIWPKILNEFPSAKLWVFGSGNLYNRSKPLGKKNIADPDYEEVLVDLIKKTNPDSIQWFGNLPGDEMSRLLTNVDVGIVNPKGKGETFCLSLFDFFNSKIPVLLNKKVRLYREMGNGCALFYNNYNQIHSILKKYLLGKIKIKPSSFERAIKRVDYQKALNKMFNKIQKFVSK